ncbi:MAG: ABC transporter permease [Caulobacteraceae bacterium]
MSSVSFGPALRNTRDHLSTIWALMLRELATRYGRNNVGFLWLVGEPLVFCVGVLILWGLIRPPYEHGIRVLPFVMTGYLPLTLIRHMIGHGLNCVKANAGLLYHRRIAVLHLFTARLFLEFVGVSLAFLVVAVVLATFGAVSAPERLGLVYGGWVLMAWISFGFAMILGALAQMEEIVERFVSVLTYILVPLSGTFYMASWLPPKFRDALMVLPFIHCVEMIRAGFFGDNVRTYYDPPYVVAWGASLTFIGLLLLRFVRERIEVD